WMCESCVDVSFFFFQAEDGIRDWSVTGVQTCALPICAIAVKIGWLRYRRRSGPLSHDRSQRTLRHVPRLRSRWPAATCIRANPRSEERRVGKEGRYRWAPDH